MFTWRKRLQYPLPAQFRCACGKEYKPYIGPIVFNPGCPGCGRLVPLSVSDARGHWRSYREQRIAELQATLSSCKGSTSASKQAHADVEALLRQQIDQLSDGSYVNVLREEIRELEDLVRSNGPENVAVPCRPPPSAQPSKDELFDMVQRTSLQMKKEELEVAENNHDHLPLTPPPGRLRNIKGD